MSVRNKDEAIGNEKKVDSDRRQSEFWLQEAVECSLFHRFCMGSNGAERALILYTKRHGSYADLTLLDAQGKLILVEVKRGRPGMNAANKAVEQLKKYATHDNEATRWTLGEIATWYCRHLIEVNSWFEYRGDYCLISEEEIEQGLRAAKKAKETSRYGRLIQWSPSNIDHYLKGARVPEEALESLRSDYARVVGASLDGLESSHRFEVGRCILIAQDWPSQFQPEPMEGPAIELWTFGDPSRWAHPHEA